MCLRMTLCMCMCVCVYIYLEREEHTLGSALVGRYSWLVVPVVSNTLATH